MTPAGPRAPTLARALPWGAAIGGLLYWFWYGGSTLDPANVDWMAKGDLATSFLGWHFFRHEPWSFPLGLLRNYGEGLGASIVLTDSIPLLALLLKPVSGLLPDTFQYFGPWVLACYVLNAAFAYALVGRFTGDRLARAAGAVLVCMAPFVTWRGIWHVSLVAHWLPLCAVWLYLTPQRHATLKWALLLAASALINPYLFGMVGVVWVAAVVADAVEAPERRTRVIVAALATVAGVALLAWVAGLFSAAGFAGSFGGYGRAPLDLLSWIDSRGTGRLNHGFQRGNADGGEGFGYLGLGAALAIFAGVVLWLQAPRAPDRRLAILVGAMAFLVLFAVSHRVHFAGQLLIELPLPEVLERAGAVFRSSGRFGWLPGYLLVIGAVALIANRMPPWIARAVLVAAVLIGFVDWRDQRKDLLAAVRAHPVAGKEEQLALVAALPSQYRRLVFVPLHYLWVDNIHKSWGFALGAAARGMAMNVAYLARLDLARFDALAAALRREVHEGPLDPASAYVTRNAAFAQGLAEKVAGQAHVVRAGEDLVILPAPPVAAPGPLAAAMPVRALPPPATIDVEFKSGGDGRYFMDSGWTIPATWGTWSEGATATLLMPAMAPAGPRKLRVFAQAYFHKGTQAVEVRVKGRPIATWEYANRDPQWKEAALDLEPGGGPYRIEFRISDPQRPSDAPGVGSNDGRLLGIALIRLRIE